MTQINPFWKQHYSVKRAVYSLEQEKDHKRANKYKGALKHFKCKPAICSQCKKGMRPDIAKVQKENNRENAPICFACILGKPRKQYS